MMKVVNYEGFLFTNNIFGYNSKLAYTGKRTKLCIYYQML